MQKTRFGDNNHPSTGFRADRKANTAPIIYDSFCDDNGDIQHILESGSTISEITYKAMWEPVRGKILPKNYKGKGLDSRTNWLT